MGIMAMLLNVPVISQPTFDSALASVTTATIALAPTPSTGDVSQLVTEPQVSMPAGMFLGDGLVPLPQCLVTRILNKDFIEMHELLPEAWVAETTEGSEKGVNSVLQQLMIRCRRTLVTDILIWTQCYTARWVSCLPNSLRPLPA